MVGLAGRRGHTLGVSLVSGVTLVVGVPLADGATLVAGVSLVGGVTLMVDVSLIGGVTLVAGVSLTSGVALVVGVSLVDGAPLTLDRLLLPFGLVGDGSGGVGALWPRLGRTGGLLGGFPSGVGGSFFVLPPFSYPPALSRA